MDDKFRRNSTFFVLDIDKPEKIMQNDYINVIRYKEEKDLAGLRHVLSGEGRIGKQAGAAQRETEIITLREEVHRLYVRNDALGRENRRLRIRNAELEVAYSGLKEVLRGRGVATS